ncbi:MULTISPECIES: hypothetical protein [unclassified Synechococcus]|uniref:hypothetical protein n=1 Tax=unclassified Synechococcus TaxID=2626047 RepID=UPI00082AEA3B|nr:MULTISPECIES: hypothetical protein [unclassified Synechococcus]
MSVFDIQANILLFNLIIEERGAKQYANKNQPLNPHKGNDGICLWIFDQSFNAVDNISNLRQPSSPAQEHERSFL